MAIARTLFAGTFTVEYPSKLNTLKRIRESNYLVLIILAFYRSCRTLLVRRRKPTISLPFFINNDTTLKCDAHIQMFTRFKAPYYVIGALVTLSIGSHTHTWLNNISLTITTSGFKIGHATHTKMSEKYAKLEYARKNTVWRKYGRSNQI